MLSRKIIPGFQKSGTSSVGRHCIGRASPLQLRLAHAKYATQVRYTSHQSCQQGGFNALSWQHTGRGKYERELDGCEIALKMLTTRGYAGKRHGDISIEVQFETYLSKGALIAHAKKAWTRLRSQYPNVAASTEGNKLVYWTPDKEGLEIETWLRETFHVIDDNQFGIREVLNSCWGTEKPCMFLLPALSTFLIYSPHHYGDGMGLEVLADGLLTGVAWDVAHPESKVHWGDEVRNLAPGLSSARPLGVAPVESQAKSSSAMAAAWNTPNALSPRSTRKIGQLGRTNWYDINFSRAESDRIFTAARANNFSVTHVVHAALINATAAQYQTSSRDKEYLSLIAAMQGNRDLGKPEYAMRFDMWIMKTRPGSFLSTAKSLREEYRTFANDKFLARLAWTNIAKYLNNTSALPPPLIHVVTSVGRLDQTVKPNYGPMRVKDVNFSVQDQSAGTFNVIRTFLGRLGVRVFYNEGFHQLINIMDYANGVRQELDDYCKMHCSPDSVARE
ncbi:hypothetical protein P170DRAFT_479951 [Aspergillus steynii IBT 23096]|uniref:Uncharacterized protein n=1 Tax=Aspergillus steynii IBT 23096 TaxID=1392250 RepID=A0A2I2FU65_9EURO|nr:uncharacterized protein P170DRAFT_479951 [Aspergillus steynii IBT 23096]PLB44185.1 hypothetical protein P170DRAFT_479951 [Aspergillus steynii IBT 23096]